MIYLHLTAAADLLEGVPDAIFDKKEKTIGYVDPASGVPSFTTRYGYYTTFTYMYYADQRKLEESDLTDHKIGLDMRCGTLSYAEIPTRYKYKIGMSGTLNCLTSHQNDVLKRYGFNIRTELPSTYKKRDLVRKPIEVLDQEKVKFLDKICEAAREKSEEGMAVLVFLQDEKRLQELKQYIKDQGKTITPLELSDSLSKPEREQNIRWSTQNQKITFVTRAYGRGTDFVCHDARAKQFGGVHLIIAFYPNDDSENRQLEGRTCRQDDPGSVQKLVWIGDLKHLGSDSPGFKPDADQDWDDYLKQKRGEYLKSRFESMLKKKEFFENKHKQTVETCQMVADFKSTLFGNQSTMLRIAHLFADASDPPKIDADVTGVEQAVTCVEMCFVMDCTGSMSASIKACQEKVITIARNIQVQCSQNMRIRMAFVAYRDYTGGTDLKYDAPGAPEICEFTEDIDHIQSFVRKQGASGGGDGPEDICGGLREALKLDWQGESRHLFLIADAPCHGSQYHDTNDNYPKGDPTNLVPEFQFEELLGSRQVKCQFLRLNASTDKMLDVFNRHCEAKLGQTVSVT